MELTKDEFLKLAEHLLGAEQLTKLIEWMKAVEEEKERCKNGR
jgi:hypothetical protein